MANTSAFILYLTVFRLSVIAAGIVSVVLGYRLFCRGIPPGSGSGTTVDATIGESRFRLANAAPGTCFALFGVIIISVMIFAGRPEMTFELINGASRDISGSENNGGERRISMAMRGDDSGHVGDAIKKGRGFEERGEYDKAIRAYQEAVSPVALPLNNLAWLYHKKGEDAKALPLARMATRILPEDANCLDTLAEIEFRAGAYAEALVLMERASRIDPRFREKLGRFRSANGKSKASP